MSSAVGIYLPSTSGTQARETAIAYNVLEISCDQQLDRGFQIPGVKVFVKQFIIYGGWALPAQVGEVHLNYISICIHKDIVLGKQIIGFFMTFPDISYSYFLQLPSPSVLTSPNSNYSLPFSHFPLQILCTLLFPSLLSSLGPFILQFLWLFQVAYSPEHLKLETKIERVHATFVLLGLDFLTQQDPFQFYPAYLQNLWFYFSF